MEQQNLIELFRKLQTSVDALGDYEMQSQLAQMRTTYSAMLRYMVQGMDDPNASRIYADLVTQVRVLRDRADRAFRLKTQGSDRYVISYKTLRPEVTLSDIVGHLRNHDEALTLLQDEPNERENIQRHDVEQHQRSREEMLLMLFGHVWTSDVWSKSVQETAFSMLTDDAVFTDDKCVLISATTLALMEMFDERKLMLLFDTYLLPEPELSQRALVGMVIVLRQYDERIKQQPEVQSRFTLLCDDPNFVRDIFRVFMQLHYSRLTDTVSEKMRSDIIPTILQSKNFKQTEYGIQEIDDFLTQNGENPEWFKNRKADTRAQEKIQEMGEMLMEGADVYMSTFSQMKNNVFFQQTAHWFYPFSADLPAVSDILGRLGSETSSVFGAMLRYAPFCDSDKFSFTFMLSMIGVQGQEGLSKSLTGSLSHDELSEMLETKKTKKRASDISRQYIFDLYRFFTLYPFHQQFHNPFDKALPTFTPLAHKVFEPLLSNGDEVLSLAEFFMRKGVYQDAIDLFEHLLPQKVEEDVDLWQKIGFCEQKQGRLEEAFECYKTAYDLNPNSQWTLKHLASVSFQGEWYAEAEVYYELLLEDEPENLRYLRRKAGCLMKQNLFADAIPLLYKALYLDEDSVEDQNNLAWCQLQESQFDKARELYGRVLSSHVNQPSAHFNMACTYLAEGNIQQAYPLFRQAYLMQSVSDGGDAQFVRDFNAAFDALQPVNNMDTERGQALLDAVRLGI